jgi:hypothetical protein
MFTVKDVPGSRLDRLWKWYPAAYLTRGSDAVPAAVYAGFELCMIRYEGKPTTRSPVKCALLGLVLNPLRWRFKQDHMYYDGPNCWYQLGPFVLSLTWDNCNKCQP